MAHKICMLLYFTWLQRVLFISAVVLYTKHCKTSYSMSGEHGAWASIGGHGTSREYPGDNAGTHHVRIDEFKHYLMHMGCLHGLCCAQDAWNKCWGIRTPNNMEGRSKKRPAMLPCRLHLDLRPLCLSLHIAVYIHCRSWRCKILSHIHATLNRPHYLRIADTHCNSKT
jgi:hypothetical protein